jgi:hypothetical protein
MVEFCTIHSPRRTSSNARAAAECVKRVARRMSDTVYALLKSDRNYDRSVVEQAIRKRQEQVANADHSHVGEALPVPDEKRLNLRAYDGN